jgi:hypothetical protein
VFAQYTRGSAEAVHRMLMLLLIILLQLAVHLPFLRPCIAHVAALLCIACH